MTEEFTGKDIVDSILGVRDELRSDIGRVASIYGAGFQSIEEFFKRTDKRFDRLEGRFDKLEERFDRLEELIERLPLAEQPDYTHLPTQAELDGGYLG